MEPLKVEEIHVDPPKATKVRAKILCASLCHSDMLSIQGFPHVCVLHSKRQKHFIYMMDSFTKDNP